MRERASAIIIQDGKLLTIHRIKNGEEYFVLPGGGIEEGETPEEGVIRELREEAEASVKVESILQKEYSPDLDQDTHYILCQLASISLDIVWQETSKQTAENSYSFKWVDIKTLHDLEIRPRNAVSVINDYLRTLGP